MTMETCVFCREAVDADNDDVCEWVTVQRHDLPAHRACAERDREENGPDDSILDPHGVGEVGWARNH